MTGTRNTGNALFQHLDVTILALGGANGVLHELQELSQILALCGTHAAKANANAAGGSASSNYPRQGESFYPDLTVREPKSDFNFRARWYGIGGFNQAAPSTGIGKIAPNGRGGTVYPKFYGYKALEAWMSAAITAPVSAE